MMKYSLWISIGVVLILISLLKFTLPSPTGAAVEEAYAYTLNDFAKKFFGVDSIIFPRQGCGDMAGGFYENIAFTPTDEIAGFDTSGSNRAATMNFVLDRVRRLGTFDMVRGEKLTDSGLDSFISINSEAIVRVPKDVRNTFFNMDLYGVSRGTFVVMKGRFSIPSMDCTFENRDGVAHCDCITHSIRDISVAGIPVPITVVERTGARWEGPGPR